MERAGRDRTDPTDRAALWTALAVMTAGVAMRLVWARYQPVFGIDEIFLAGSVVTRSYAGLWHSLDFDQICPPLFLMAVKLVVAWLGDREWVFRLPSMVGAVIAPVFVWLAARRLLGGGAAVVATALAAACPMALWYSNFFKPYSTDPAVSAMLLWLTAGLLRDTGARWRWIALGIAGAMAPALSSGSVLVLAGVWLALASDERARRGAERTRLVGLAVAWAAVTGLLYFRVYEQNADSAYMRYFWSGVMGRYALEHPTFLLHELFGQPSRGSGLPGIFGLAAAAAGFLVWLRRKRWTALILVTTPVVLLTIAHLAALYPAYDRLTLFVYPQLFILMAAATQPLFERVPARWQTAAVAVVPLLFVPGFHAAWSRFPASWSDNLRGRLAQRLRENGDAVYIMARAIPGWAYYTLEWPGGADRYAELERLYQFGSPVFGDAPPRRGKAFESVAGLTWSGAGRAEVLGLADGLDNRMPVGAGSKVPDPGWGEHEARRIREAAKPCAWIESLHASDVERAALLDAVIAAGGKVDVADPLVNTPGMGAALVRVCWGNGD